jgi:hypothetical protein
MSRDIYARQGIDLDRSTLADWVGRAAWYLDPPAVGYVYAPDRKGERPAAHLTGFAGILQVDGYAGYRALEKTGAVQLAFCWAHVRRGFHEIAAGGSAPIATEALKRIAALYRIEREIRGLSADERRVRRQAQAKTIIDALHAWLTEQLKTKEEFSCRVADTEARLDERVQAECSQGGKTFLMGFSP